MQLPVSGVEIATLADLVSVLDLVSTQYHDPYNSEAYWRWRYFNNPVADVAIYVIRGERGQVVAMQPSSTYTMMANGSVCRASFLTAAVTHPDYRRRGLFRKLVTRIAADLEQRGDSFIYTFPNETSVQGFRRFNGWQQRELLSLWVRPLWSPNWLKPEVHSALDIQPEPPLQRERVGELVLDETPHLDASTEPLLHMAFSDRVAYIQRSCSYLEWRYANNPVSSYSIQQAWRGHELAGYVVVKVSRLYGLRAGLIADLVAVDRDAARALVRRAVQVAKQFQMQILAYLVGQYNPYRVALLRTSFLPVPNRFLPRHFYLYTYPTVGPSHRKAATIREAPWHVTWGDTDVV